MRGAASGAAAGGIADAVERARALDVTRSFVVQAPAGSGKTGLLVQRFLALLARVERPEAVLAMTFTRKAAGEMRRRIFEALTDAKTRERAPDADFEKTRHELASAVLERDAALGWGLLHSPSRLQVFTIDGFCSRVVAGTPLLSRLGSTPAVVDNAGALHREAVRRALASSGRALLGDQFEILLERYEMGLDRLETQLVDMLARRDQWRGGALRSHHDERVWVADVEAAFLEAISAEVASIAADAEPGLVARIHDIARRSRDAVGADSAWPTLGDGDKLGAGADSAYAWKQAAAMLTKTDKLRRRATKDQDVHGSDNALKEDFKALLDDIASLSEERVTRWVDGLAAASKLPVTPTFSEDGRRALGAFLAVLRQAYATLWDVSRQWREVDHTEIAMGAVAALAPGETLERLDARVEHILVDEFQDTNVLQCDLLRGLTSGWQNDDGRTLFLVGDPMQSIYRFRKAEVGLFLAARSSPRFFENCRLESLALSVNFRSTFSVVGWVNQAFAKLLGNRDDSTRSLVAFAAASAKPDADEGEAVDLVLWSTGGDASGAEADAAEAAGLANWIAEHARGHREHGDRSGHAAPIAVLVRARSHALPLLRALEAVNEKVCSGGAADGPRDAAVRVRAPGLDMLADRGIVVDLEAMTRALLHPGDRLSCLALLRSPWIGLTLADLAALVEADVAAASSAMLATPIPLLMRDAAALARVGDDARRRIARAAQILDEARRDLSSRSIDVVVRAMWLRLGGLAADPEAARIEALDAEAYFELLAAAVRNGRVDLDDFARTLRSTEAPVDADAEVDVEIMTMHKAKGLEFDTVILPALARKTGASTTLPLAMETEPDTGELTLVAPRGARGRDDADDDKYDFLQHRERRRSDAEILRLLYVAATRARRLLVLSAAEARLKKDGTPPAGSLLKALEPAVNLEAARVVVVQPAKAAPRRAMMRLPADFTLALRPRSVADLSIVTESPSEFGEAAPAFFAASKVSAHVGTVYHAFVQRIAADGLAAWPVSRVAGAGSAIAHALRSAGVLADERKAATSRVCAALVATLEDDRGRWILTGHEGARSEWALLSYRERRLTSAVLDRSFVADGARWVIDFKTGRRDAESGESDAATAAAVTEKCTQYVPQLSRYRELLRAGSPGLPVRLALYFPEWSAGQRWQEITGLADAYEHGASA